MFPSYEAMPLFTVVSTVAYLPVVVFFYSIDIKKNHERSMFVI
jgi:hypothetical protein